ncbi:oxidoreductase [Parvibaculaceae bacterium PLY_AMNH_Bact1]|nr:oxidoreductase [Parvibaculaceae bacterium PLY_AMNH_Bact1]
MSTQESFGHGTEAGEVVKGISLAGKTAIVTGGASGLGVETARALLQAGAAVTLPVRSLERGNEVAKNLSDATGNPNISIAEMDLIDYASVRSFAEGFLTTHDRLDILINNAGIMACPLARSPEGYESQFATNHLGHMLLTCKLAPALIKAAPARVVCLSSIGHRLSPIRFDDINFETTDYDKWVAYGQAKTANALFAVELNRRLSEKGVTAFSVHPGGIMTNLQRDMSDAEIKGMGWVDDEGNVREGFKTPAGGAATAVWAATSASLNDRGGEYCEDCHIAEPARDDVPFAGVQAHARDADAAKKLWAESEKMLGETFNL